MNDLDLQAELDRRLAELVTQASRRRETRAAQRNAFARNRNAGLKLRHQLKENNTMSKTIATPEHLTHFELDTVPFTEWELKGIARYEEDTLGNEDSLSFEALNAADWCDAPNDPGFKTELYRTAFAEVRDWYEKLDSLYSDLANGGEGPRFSRAGHKYLKHACITWYRALNVLRCEACKWAYDTAGPQPSVEAGYLTFGDIPGIELDGTIAAESTF